MLPIWLESTVFFSFSFSPALLLSLSALIGFYFPAILMMPIVYEEQQPVDIALLRVFVCIRLKAAFFCLYFFWGEGGMVLENHIHMTWTSTGSGGAIDNIG